jgi:ABC-type multidrug transport system ATPase subunit
VHVSDVLWELHGVRLNGGARPRLADVTLQVRSGVTAVLGCSGAGKTSLLNLLVGFEKPDAGRLLRLLPSRGGRLPLYWVPQRGGLWPHRTVREHLAAVLPGAAPPDGVDRLLAELDIAHRAGACPGELSMGEQARLAVARALAADPAVLVMDEPLAHVDVAGADRCWLAVRRCAAQRAISLIYATHVPRTVLGEAGHVVCLREGRLIYEGEVDELYLRPPTREAAEALGEVNWLEPAEEATWLSAGADGRRCYRPEHLVLRAEETGPLVVRDHRAKGPLAESELEHPATGQVRRFFHRPPDRPAAAGARVRLTVAAWAVLCLAALVCGGCRPGRDPALKVRQWRARPLPRDGTRLPAPRCLAATPDGGLIVVDDAGRILTYGPGGELLRQWRTPDTSAGRPEGVLVLRDGRIAVCDTHYHRVLIFEPDGKLALQFGSEGREPGRFVFPVAIAADPQDNLYICEYGGNDRVQVFRPDGTFVRAFGSFGTGPGQFQRPSGVVWHKGRLYVADAVNNRIQVFADTGEFAGILGGAAAPELGLPYDVCLGGDDALYVVEYRAGRVTKLDTRGRVLGRYGGTGHGEGNLRTPWGLAAGSAGADHAEAKLLPSGPQGPPVAGRLWIADTGNRRLVELEL